MNIAIVEVDLDNIGRPRGDGSPGSALYRVPLKLNMTPPPGWDRLFVQTWDRPPSFTTMHRPGIASVYADRIVLDGTTIEEVRDVHLSTLKLCVAEANRKYEEAVAREQLEEQRRETREREHDAHVRDVARGIKFD